MSGKVLFVCTANICRSPMAEFIFNDLASERGLPFVAQSAGVVARSNMEMDAEARSALEEIGVEALAHGSRRVSPEMSGSYDLILTVSDEHSRQTGDILGGSENIYTISEYADPGSGSRELPDPHGLSMFAYRSSARSIYEYVEKIFDRLSKESS